MRVAITTEEGNFALSMTVNFAPRSGSNTAMVSFGKRIQVGVISDLCMYSDPKVGKSYWPRDIIKDGLNTTLLEV